MRLALTCWVSDTVCLQAAAFFFLVFVLNAAALLFAVRAIEE